jgi:membrane protease YdiL (CAAX protease family)
MSSSLQKVHKRDTWIALPYFGAYVAYLFWNPESDYIHWVTLVALPLLLVWALQPASTRQLATVLASFGVSKGNFKRGVLAAVALSILACVLQLFGSRYSEEILEVIRSGAVFYLLPLALLLLFLTAGFTEEFFFRGFLLTRLELIFGSRWLALVASSLCFGLYHLPYAYLNPSWPSSGDLSAAFASAMAQGVAGGLLLGALYIGSKRNLLPCVILHSSINAFPAMTMIEPLAG